MALSSIYINNGQTELKRTYIYGSGEWTNYEGWIGHFYADNEIKKCTAYATLTLNSISEINLNLNYNILPLRNDRGPYILELRSGNVDIKTYALYQDQRYVDDNTGNLTITYTGEHNLKSCNKLYDEINNTNEDFSFFWNTGTKTNKCAYYKDNYVWEYNDKYKIIFYPYYSTTKHDKPEEPDIIYDKASYPEGPLQIKLKFSTPLSGNYTLYINTPKIYHSEAQMINNNWWSIDNNVLTYISSAILLNRNNSTLTFESTINTDIFNTNYNITDLITVGINENENFYGLIARYNTYLANQGKEISSIPSTFSKGNKITENEHSTILKNIQYLANNISYGNGVITKLPPNLANLEHYSTPVARMHMWSFVQNTNITENNIIYNLEPYYVVINCIGYCNKNFPNENNN